MALVLKKIMLQFYFKGFSKN